jgi:hypothetical protein
MCLVVAGIFSYLAFSFYQDGLILHTIINGTIALFFIGLLVRNIIKTKKMKRK